MLKIPVTKDITKIQSSYAKIGYTVLGCAVGVGIFLLLRNLIGSQTAAIVGLIFAVPLALPGYIRPYNIALTTFVKRYIMENFIQSKKLYYKRKLTKRELTYQTEYTAGDMTKKQIENYINRHKEFRSYK